MFPGPAPSGQWARARNTEGAKLFLAEQEMDRQRAASRRSLGGRLGARLGVIMLAVVLLILTVLGVLGTFGVFGPLD